MLSERLESEIRYTMGADIIPIAYTSYSGKICCGNTGLHLEYQAALPTNNSFFQEFLPEDFTGSKAPFHERHRRISHYAWGMHSFLNWWEQLPSTNGFGAIETIWGNTNKLMLKSMKTLYRTNNRDIISPFSKDTIEGRFYINLKLLSKNETIRTRMKQMADYAAAQNYTTNFPLPQAAFQIDDLPRIYPPSRPSEQESRPAYIGPFIY